MTLLDPVGAPPQGLREPPPQPSYHQSFCVLEVSAQLERVITAETFVMLDTARLGADKVLDFVVKSALPSWLSTAQSAPQ